MAPTIETAIHAPLTIRNPSRGRICRSAGGRTRTSNRPSDSRDRDRRNPGLERLAKHQARHQRQTEKGAVQQQQPTEDVGHETTVHEPDSSPTRRSGFKEIIEARSHLGGRGDDHLVSRLDASHRRRG